MRGAVGEPTVDKGLDQGACTRCGISAGHYFWTHSWANGLHNRVSCDANVARRDARSKGLMRCGPKSGVMFKAGVAEEIMSGIKRRPKGPRASREFWAPWWALAYNVALLEQGHTDAQRIRLLRDAAVDPTEMRRVQTLMTLAGAAPEPFAWPPE